MLHDGSRTQTAKRHDQHAIIAFVCDTGRGQYHHERRPLIGIHILSQFQEVRCRCVDGFLRTQLHYDRLPRSVSECDHSIDFETPAIAIVAYLSTDDIRIRPEIANAEVLNLSSNLRMSSIILECLVLSLAHSIATFVLFRFSIVVLFGVLSTINSVISGRYVR